MRWPLHLNKDGRTLCGRQFVARMKHASGNLAANATCVRCLAIYRKEPHALPAEVEAVVAKLARIADPEVRPFAFDETMWKAVRADVVEAATLLRRYAQAVAEKDADRKHFRARVFLASSGGSSDHSTGCTIWGDDGQGHTEEGFMQPLPCNCGALINFHKKEVVTLQREAREKDAEIARLRAIEERAKSYRALLTPGSYCEISEFQVFDNMTAILWEEH